ncbi:hypothetical protein [Paenibacillus pabuli]|uniref:hypothetical protein n=1 Tax=Paenibacillus pabuli TaxID=1472 RepID=UPI001FFE9D10|nr:hypothetical protein [Paenibacillus pabuli]UPK43437.1 hypothetical protein KET34_30950 [Paenibacillus pabuli]
MSVPVFKGSRAKGNGDPSRARRSRERRSRGRAAIQDTGQEAGILDEAAGIQQPFT